MPIFRGALALLISLLILTAPVNAGAEISLNPVGAWAGPVNGIFVDGNIAYFGSGRRLVIADVTDASNVIELSSIDLANTVLDVQVREGIAYVPTDGVPNFFSVVDVSSLTSPQLLDGYALNPLDVSYRPEKVELFGNYAYVLDDESVRVWNISDPLKLVLEGSVPFDANDYQIVDDIMYVAAENGASGSGLETYRIVDPLAPEFLAYEPLVSSTDLLSVAIEGTRAYVTTRNTDENGTVHVLDVTDPEQPQELGMNDEPIKPNDVAISNGFAYVADMATSAWLHAGTLGLIVYDVATDPANPTIVTSVQTHGGVRGVEVIGDRLYVYDDAEGLLIFDLSDPADPTQIGNFYSPEMIRKTTFYGDQYLIAVDMWNGFTILDISEEQPQIVGIHQTAIVESAGDPRVGENWGIAVHGTMAYLSAGFSGVEVVDISDVANPQLVGEYRFDDPGPSQAVAMAVSEGEGGQVVAHVGYLYRDVFTSSARLLNLDVTDPSTILVLGQVDVSNWEDNGIRSIKLNDDGIAFLATNSKPTIVDTSDVANPVESPALLLATDPGEQEIHDVDLVDGIVYWSNRPNAAAFGGLFQQDYNDVTNPMQLAGHLMSRATAVAVENGGAYLVALDGFQKLFALDVSDPTIEPVEMSELNVSNHSEDHFVTVEEPYVYVSGSRIGTNAHRANRGLIVVKVDGLEGNPADLDGDGTVGPADLAQLLGSWGTCSSLCAADLDGNGVVGPPDLAQLLGAWG